MGSSKLNEMALIQFRKVVASCALSLAAIAVFSCSAGEEVAGLPAWDEPSLAQRDASAAAPCEPGDVRECSLTLARHEGILSCYHGTQSCKAEGAWGACGKGKLETIKEPVLKSDSTQHTQALSTADDCENNPCDPYCQDYEETPEGGPIETVISGSSTYAWQTGSLASLPNGLVNKGLVEPCSTGSDCQFNTYCRYPDSGACEHNKCSTGDALAASCDACVEDICAVAPDCCTSTSEDECDHDPCAVGDNLKATCDPCVEQICETYPDCCANSGAWDETCVAAVTSICNESCGCCEGETGFGGHCYTLDNTDRDWDDAQNTCEDYGSGNWNLVSIGDEDENDFVYDWNSASGTWVGLEQGNGGDNNKWFWTNSDPVGPWLESTGSGMYDNFAASEPDGSGDCARINANEAGVWRDGNCNDDHDSVCEGLPECKGGTVPPPAACVHDLCEAGTALTSGCNSCVTQICAADPDCCSTSWDADCVAAVEALCEHTCGCSAGTEYDGSCYYKEETNQTWSAARTACQALGSGWDLVGITDDAENTYVNESVIDGDNAWIGFTDSTTAGTWAWASGSPAGNWLQAGTVVSTVIAYGAANWKYLAPTATPASWTTVAFDDSAWSTGTAELGFGDSDEVTTIAPTSRQSYYFRKSFTLTELPSAATLNTKYDDGFYAYINGTQVDSQNVSGTGHTTYASSTAENSTKTTSISTTPFVVGTNVLAIQMKRRNAGDSDLSVDAKLDLTLATAGGGIYQNFVTGEPNSTGDCARMNSANTGYWADVDCATTYDSVCEGPPNEMLETGPVTISGTGTQTAIALGAYWRYRDVNSDPGATWNSVAFDDSAWSVGVAEFGWGDSDEATTLTSGTPSVYFRKILNIENAVSAASLSVTFDDGYAVYVNGTQVANQNVSSVAHASYATATSSDNEVEVTSISVTPFVVGENVVAVVVKNASAASSDVSFDLELELTLESESATANTWSQACVDAVATVCDAQCDTADPPAETGLCTPWYPGQTDPACAGVDLAIGVPCDDSIPVCNHGNTEAPAGVKLVHFPGNSQQYPSCSPDLSHPQVYECETDEPIPPGECINVTTCPHLTGNRELMVNPAGSDYVDECSCLDNWSLYSSGSDCGAPVCAGGTSVATLTAQPVDIIVIIDNSSSMGGEIEAVQQRINEDLAAIIGASGIDYRVVMVSRYGDVDVVVGDSDHPICVSQPLGGNTCTDPANEALINNAPTFYHYSTDIGSHNSWCRILQGWSTSDELAADTRTWTAVAPNGLQDLLREEAFKAFLVITDDDVDCSYGGYSFNDGNSAATGATEAAEFDAALLALSPSHFGTSADRNYVWHSIVGMAANSPSTTPWPATAAVNTAKCSATGSDGPGTGYQALSRLTGGLRYPSCQNDDFDAMFQALATEIIDGAEVSCSFDLENEGEFDPNLTTVTFTAGNGTSSEFSNVGNVASCTATGYYYADGNTVTLCPDACSTVQGDADGSLGVEVGCGGTAYGSYTFSETYEGVCSSDAHVQWGFLAYDTTTPDDSSVVFEVRVANTEAELADASYMELATASLAAATEDCLLTGPAPCPVDLYEALGGGADARANWLELRVTLNPNTDANQTPGVENWQLTYSCPPAQ